jgi:hypothetical protein
LLNKIEKILRKICEVYKEKSKIKIKLKLKRVWIKNKLKH